MRAVPKPNVLVQVPATAVLNKDQKVVKVTGTGVSPTNQQLGTSSSIIMDVEETPFLNTGNTSTSTETSSHPVNHPVLPVPPKPTPVTLQTFLDTFKRSVDEGIEFLKKKITDPDTGLETRVEDLEELVLKDDTGLKDRVEDLEKVVKDPVTGLLARVNSTTATNTATVGASATTSNAGAITSEQYRALNGRILDLENQLATTKFESKVLIHWADNLYKDHKSLQK